ncbi:iron-sulfur cluster assembly protein [Gordonia sp. NPDC003376]
MTTMTEVADIVVREEQLRISEADALAALSRVHGESAVNARTMLRYGPGRTCEPLARMLDAALIRAGDAGLDVESLVLDSGTASAAEDIVRVRRKAHGVADWIRSPTSEVTLVLRPRGVAGIATAGPDTAGAGPADAGTAMSAVGRAATEAAATEQSAPTAERPAAPEGPAERAVREALYDVIDPDLGVNIVDLGFIRRIHIDPTGRAIIAMTLTSAACPLTVVMEGQIRSVLSAMDTDFEVCWEWLPSWRPSEITEDGRDQLRAIGFSAF